MKPKLRGSCSFRTRRDKWGANANELLIMHRLSERITLPKSDFHLGLFKIEFLNIDIDCNTTLDRDRTPRSRRVSSRSPATICITVHIKLAGFIASMSLLCVSSTLYLYS